MIRLGNDLGYCHALGTARMGPPNDDGALVNSDCLVRGLQNLWVVDASVIPVPPRVVPNLTIMMTAERMADALPMGSWIAPNSRASGFRRRGLLIRAGPSADAR